MQTALRAFFPPAIPPERDIKKTGTRKKDRTDGGLRDAQAEEGFFAVLVRSTSASWKNQMPCINERANPPAMLGRIV